MSESHKHAARRRFDRWAKRYESDRRSRLNAKPQQAALAALELQPDDRLLDVGCGTGAAVPDGVADRRAARIADRILRLVDRGHFRLYRTEELVSLMRSAGLGDIGVDRLWDGGFAVIRARRSAPQVSPPDGD